MFRRIFHKNVQVDLIKNSGKKHKTQEHFFRVNNNKKFHFFRTIVKKKLVRRILSRFHFSPEKSGQFSPKTKNVTKKTHCENPSEDVSV